MAATQEQLNEVLGRLKTLEDFVLANKLPASATGERSIAKALLDMEIYVKTLLEDPPMKMSHQSDLAKLIGYSRGSYALGYFGDLQDPMETLDTFKDKSSG